MTKLALLTGGSGAIGGATVSLLHERGWTVEAPTRTRLNMLLGPVMVIRDSIAQIGDEPLGALVFCHGEWFSSDSQGLTDWKRQYASRVVTPARLIDVLLPQLAGGCVVMVASTQAFGGRYQTGPYGAACAGQVRLMQGLAQGKPATRFNVVAPGLTAGRMAALVRASGDCRPDAMPQDPAAVAAAIVGLVEGDMTGQVLRVVDGQVTRARWVWE